MMMIKFYKYQGTGNDFIMIDNRAGTFDRNNHQLVQRLCERRFGIGADGLILIENNSEVDFEVVYYNADASQSLCGNGSRCAVRFAEFLKIIKDTATFLAIDGVHEAKIKPDIIKLKMHDVARIEAGDDYYFIDTGSPHYVSFCDNNQNLNVVELGKQIRYNDRFKDKGVNVNFVHEIAKDIISVRTYERGVEGETFSCGTGVTACAIAYAIKNDYQEGSYEIQTKTLGGNLSINLTLKKYQVVDIWLNGPAEEVFQGEIKS